MSVRSTALLTYIGNEVPNGVVDANNKLFELSNNPLLGSVVVRLSGICQVPGPLKDYEIVGTQISFIKAPKIGQEVVCNYFTA